MVCKGCLSAAPLYFGGAGTAGFLPLARKRKKKRTCHHLSGCKDPPGRCPVVVVVLVVVLVVVHVPQMEPTATHCFAARARRPRRLGSLLHLLISIVAVAVAVAREIRHRMHALEKKKLGTWRVMARRHRTSFSDASSTLLPHSAAGPSAIVLCCCAVVLLCCLSSSFRETLMRRRVCRRQWGRQYTSSARTSPSPPPCLMPDADGARLASPRSAKMPASWFRPSR